MEEFMSRWLENRSSYLGNYLNITVIVTQGPKENVIIIFHKFYTVEGHGTIPNKIVSWHAKSQKTSLYLKTFTGFLFRYQLFVFFHF